METTIKTSFNFAKEIQCNFITKNNPEDFKPDYYYEILVTDVEGYAPTFIEYYTWDEDEDGPIPGIKLFKDFNIYLEREYCEY